jgi:hypothetical protein
MPQRLSHLSPGPIIVTSWVAAAGEPPAVGCPACRTWFSVERVPSGAPLQCSRCGQRLTLNSFRIVGDWRSVARAWSEVTHGG